MKNITGKESQILILLGFLVFQAPNCMAWEFTTPTKPNYVYMAGTGTAEDPYQISNAEELVTLCSYVNSVEKYSIGKYFKLTKDIFLNDKVLNEDGTLTTDTVKLKKWKPCGQGKTTNSLKTFQGTFDGDNHTISGIYINDTTQQDLGLFGFLHRGAEIKNLTIKDSYIRGTGAIGAICGQSHYGIITNCTSFARVESVGPTIQVGGIAGSVHGKETEHTATLINCTNYGTIIGKSVPDEYGGRYNCYVGGICGDLSSSANVKECTNEGFVYADGWGAAGGITGTVTGGASVAGSTNKGTVTSNAHISMGGISGNNWEVIRECRNEGEIIPTVKGCTIGGICGTCSFNSRIYNSVNVADIKTDVDSLTVGGICGNARAESSYGSYYSIIITGCTNEGNIGLGGYLSLAGGICGRNYSADIRKSKNSGNITTDYYAAGISPLCEYHSSVEESENTGTIKGRTYIGGIVGKTTDMVVACNNRGSVSPLNSGGTVGGVAAYLSSSSCYVINCFNTGHISNGYMMGGVMGHAVSSGSVRNCYNAGLISAETKAYIGGVCGYSARVTNSYNVGEIRSTGDNSFVGSISGYSYGSITNCYDMGETYSYGKNSITGYLAGDFSISSSRYYNFRNCYYLEGALHGEHFTNRNIYEIGLTSLQEDDFRTLATRLNVVEYWDEKLPYVQGYYRPLLTNYYEENDPSYFTVTSMNSNETVLIDMGRPMDNTFFMADTTGLLTEAFNVVSGKSFVKNAMIIDEKGINIEDTLKTGNLCYQRKNMKEYETLCLPFDVTSDDFTKSSILLRPTLAGRNYVVLNDTLEAAQAGKPFILHNTDSIESITIEKNSAIIIPTADSLSMLVGTFQTAIPDSSNLILTNTDSTYIFRIVSGQDSLTAFRAYLKPTIMTGSDSLKISDRPKIHQITYQVNEKVYATDSLTFGSIIVPVATPEEEGHTFSGWNNIPTMMPDSSIVILGSFTINTYKLTYTIDDTEIATDSITYNQPIPLMETPTKEGHTFSGWNEVPQTMPAKDVIITGTFTPNTYLLLYIVDGKEYATVEVTYGDEITLLDIPTKEGYLFSGWSNPPQTMPAHNVTVIGSFEVDAIENTTTDTPLVDVYTLQGVKIMHQVSTSEIKHLLPHGVYIINGKKQIVR